VRAIHDHETNPCNASIRVTANDQNPDNGNASHVYYVDYRNKYGAISEQVVSFQDGPIKEAGVNGTTQEVLLAILIDRLRCFQTSAYANSFNQEALDHCEHALAALKARTAERETRGVEGTHKL
jgi:hypothetical protein